ncbi:MAG: hypothetical protein ACTH2Q_09640 [Propionibacteriaceae bacterium]
MPTDVDLRDLPRGVRAELRGLPKELSEMVGAHLVAAGYLIDRDPVLAYAHAEAARRRAARLPVVREAAAETAYAAGEFAAALNEYRALRRMTGNHDFLPVMADCERALGRPQQALKLARESREQVLDPTQQVEMQIVESGARSDLGQAAEAQRILKSLIDSGEAARAGRTPAARAQYAYADLLLAAGNEAAARKWFESAAELDSERSTDAAERVDALSGLAIEFDESEDDVPEPDESEDD